MKRRTDQRDFSRLVLALLVLASAASLFALARWAL